MGMTVADTLQAIAGLCLPVVRTCHFGNTPANNHGWLGLCRNTYFGPMEHTLFGLDDIFYPWVILGDGGVVDACFNHRGEPVADVIGRHVNTLQGSVPRKYRSFLNFGIFAQYEDEDLASYHYQLTASLARDLNGSDTVSRAAEVVALRPLLTGLLRRLHRKRQLELLFNKWVRTTRSSSVIALKIQRIEYASPDDVAIYTTDSDLNFSGSIDSLIETFFAGLEQVSERLRRGRRFGALSYPWFSVFFNLILNAVKEYAVDSTQKTFWHAGASTSALYVQHGGFQQELSKLVRTLEEEGYLPNGAELRVIPTFSCQLFATRAESLLVLEALISRWRDYLKRDRERTSRYLEAFERTACADQVVENFYREIEPHFVQELGRRLAEFNAIDPHHLPIAYQLRSDHPTYNKYGIAQRNLSYKKTLFPQEFLAMKWGEAELLTRMLGRIVIEQVG